MPQQGITFNGAYIPLPGVYYGDDVSASSPSTPPTTPPLIAIMYSWGPKPKTPVKFTNPQNLLSAMRGAPGAVYVPALANPSPALNGAQLITLIDPSSNTQSQLALATSGGATQTLLTSTQYGPPSNQLTALVSNGSPGLNLTLTDNYAGLQLQGTNLTVPFQLAYSGSTTGGVTYTVTSAAFTITSPNVVENVTIPLGGGGYSTTSLVTEFLNGTGFYFANGLSSTGGQLPSNLLTVTGGVVLPPPSGGALQYVNVRAYAQDIAFWVNQFASTMATAAVSGSAVDTSAGLPVTGSATFFSGARGIPPTNSDYATALNVALGVPGWTVFCDSNTPAVQALLAQHVETASSTPYGMWRRGFTGSNIGDSVTATIANATGLDSIQMCYLYPGIYVTNTQTGQNVLQPGLYAAACAAAMATGNQIAQPLTNKQLNGTGLEQPGGAPLTQSQLSQLQNGGVMALYLPQSTGVPTILSDVTTWQGDDNVENTSSQQIACRYWLAYSLVNTLLPYVGTIASPTNEAFILKKVKKTLNALIFTGASSNGVLASWGVDANGATVPLTLVFNGEQQLAGITLTAQLVSQNKFITVFSTLLPLSFTISTTATST